MITTLSDEQMLKHFNSHVSQVVSTATALQSEVPSIDPINVNPIIQDYGMKWAHQSLCSLLRLEQRAQMLTEKDRYSCEGFVSSNRPALM